MASNFVDRSGLRSGSLTVLRRSHQDKQFRWHWVCRCDCGVEAVKCGSDLTQSNKTNDCGCGLGGDGRIKHGKARRNGGRSPLYQTWKSIRNRCRNPNVLQWKNYGGRGITLCENWNSFEVFESDILKLGWKPGLTIDRIDNNGNYEPENVRVATMAIQSRNTRRNRILNHNGKEMCVSDWSKKTGFHPSTITQRLNKLGWSTEEALTARLYSKLNCYR